METWHQQQARARAHRLRNVPAHILRGDFLYTGLTLCGIKDPLVSVSLANRHKPENHCCKRCLAIANKQAAQV